MVPIWQVAVHALHHRLFRSYSIDMINSTFRLQCGLFLLLGLIGCSTPLSEAGVSRPMTSAPDGFWDHWGDGKAELAGYALKVPRYGQLRSGEAVLVTVTEDFTAEQRVKSDGGHGDEYPVLKLNELRDFQTGIYDYNLMTSAFLRLDGVIPLGLPDKVSFSMQEWCGHAYEELVIGADSLDRMSQSYFDGETVANTSRPMPARAVIADAMPLLVRGLGGELLGPGETRSVQWLPRASERHMLHRAFAWTEASMTRSSGTQKVTVPAGTFDVYTLTVTPTGSAASTWMVQSSAPHMLVKWSRADGEVGTLTGAVRRSYWNDQGEGRETLRQELGLPARRWPEGGAP